MNCMYDRAPQSRTLNKLQFSNNSAQNIFQQTFSVEVFNPSYGRNNFSRHLLHIILNQLHIHLLTVEHKSIPPFLNIPAHNSMKTHENLRHFVIHVSDTNHQVFEFKVSVKRKSVV